MRYLLPPHSHQAARRSCRWYHPRLLPLEDRIPLGDALGGLLVGWLVSPGGTALAVVEADLAEPTASSAVWPRSRPADSATVSLPTEATPRPETEHATPQMSALGTADFGWPSLHGWQETGFAGPWSDDLQQGDLFENRAGRAKSPALVRDLTATTVGSPEGESMARLFGSSASRPEGESKEVPLARRPSDRGSLADQMAQLALVVRPVSQLETAAMRNDPVAAHEQIARENYGRLPLSFEANRGQTDAGVHFLARGSGYTLFLTSTEAVMTLSKPALPEAGDDLASDRLDAGRVGRTTGINPVAHQETVVVRMQVLGGNATPAVFGREPLPGKVNYFLGNDSAKWHTDIPTFARVEYQDVYAGIGLVYYGNQQNELEYDFVVAPGADPSLITLGFAGADRLEVDAQGDLVVHAGGVQLRQHKPFVYQEVDGVKREVSSSFVLKPQQQIGFRVGGYDATRPLVVDPVLGYSTYLGGGNADFGLDIAIDSAGNSYVTGVNPGDIFVVKLTATGSLVYSTYFGGRDAEVAYDIAVDADGNAHVAGYTRSTDFPTMNPLQPALGGGTCGSVPCPDAFVTKLNPAGSALVYSTYLGGGPKGNGSGWDTAYAIAVDGDGNATVAGWTGSNNFPTWKPFQGKCIPSPRQCSDAFVSKLNADGAEFVYSTYLGGSRDEWINSIAMDNDGNAYVTGWTVSGDFPIAGNPFQPGPGGNPDIYDAFVTKVIADGSALVYSSYLGGGHQEFGYGIAVDVTRNAYVTGLTESRDFPTANPLQPTCANPAPGCGDVFVAKVDATGSALVYSTYLGGRQLDKGSGIAVDRNGNAYVTGWTNSTDFPITNPLQPTLRGDSDAFVAKLNGSGSALVYSTYLGGSGEENRQEYDGGIAVDADGNAYVTGSTASTNFPIASAFQPRFGGDRDAFVAKIDPLTVVLEEINFKAAGNVNIRIDETLDIGDPEGARDEDIEWVREFREGPNSNEPWDSSQSAPAAFIRENPLRAEAKFSVTDANGDVTGITVRGTNTGRYGSFSETVVAISDGVGTATFTTVAGAAVNAVDLNDITIGWQLQAVTVDGQTIPVRADFRQTKHRIYTLLDTPLAPMTEPWAKVLELSAGIARNRNTDLAVVEELTRGTHHSRWSSFRTTARFLDPQATLVYVPFIDRTDNVGITHRFEAQVYDLTNFLSFMSEPENVQQCNDNANLLTILARSLGVSMSPLWVAHVNPPQNPDEDWPPMVETTYSPAGRTEPETYEFYFHQFGFFNGIVYDASTRPPRTSGDPNMGRSLNDYLDNVFPGQRQAGFVTRDVTTLRIGTATGTAFVFHSLDSDHGPAGQTSHVVLGGAGFDANLSLSAVERGTSIPARGVALANRTLVSANEITLDIIVAPDAEPRIIEIRGSKIGLAAPRRIAFTIDP